MLLTQGWSDYELVVFSSCAQVPHHALVFELAHQREYNVASSRPSDLTLFYCLLFFVAEFQGSSANLRLGALRVERRGEEPSSSCLIWTIFFASKLFGAVESCFPFGV